MKRKNSLNCSDQEKVHTPKLFYGIKCEGDQVNLDDFICIISNYSQTHPSKVLDLFNKMDSYSYLYPTNYISKWYCINYFIY